MKTHAQNAFASQEHSKKHSFTNRKKILCSSTQFQNFIPFWVINNLKKKFHANSEQIFLSNFYLFFFLQIEKLAITKLKNKKK